MPLKAFFASLAEDQKSAAIGVILSGTASDGTVGLHAIKSEGGVTFAQEPKSAGYPGMPESAILAGCVGFVLPPDEIARELVRLEHLPYARRTATVLEAGPAFVDAADLQKILRRYESYLEQNAGEVAALCQDIFIHVTHFFREPETFAALHRKVLPKLIANRPFACGFSDAPPARRRTR